MYIPIIRSVSASENPYHLRCIDCLNETLSLHGLLIAQGKNMLKTVRNRDDANRFSLYFEEVTKNMNVIEYCRLCVDEKSTEKSKWIIFLPYPRCLKSIFHRLNKAMSDIYV